MAVLASCMVNHVRSVIAILQYVTWHTIDNIAPLSTGQNNSIRWLSCSHSDHLKSIFRFVRFILAFLFLFSTLLFLFSTSRVLRSRSCFQLAVCFVPVPVFNQPCASFLFLFSTSRVLRSCSCFQLAVYFVPVPVFN